MAATPDLHQLETYLPLLRLMHDGAPAGTERSEWVGRMAVDGVSGGIKDDGRYREYAWRADDPQPADLMVELQERLHVPAVGLRLEARSDGAVEVDVLDLDGPTRGGQVGEPVGDVVLAPEAVPAPRRVESPPREAPAAPADPDAVTALVRSLAPSAQGVDEGRLDAYEQHVGAPLPADLRALYASIDAGRLSLGRLAGGLSLLEVLPLADGDRAGIEDRLEWHKGAFELAPVDPAGFVRDLVHSPYWLPFARGQKEDLYSVDLAPGPNGRAGQVVRSTSYRPGARRVAESISDLLLNGEHPSPTGMPDPDRRELRLRPEDGVLPADLPAELEVLHLAPTLDPRDLSPLEGHLRLRTVHAARQAVSSTVTFGRMPALEYLSMSLQDWVRLLAHGALPESLMVMRVHSAPDDLIGVADVVSQALRSRGLEPLTVHHLAGTL